MFPILCLRCAQLGVKLARKGPKLHHFACDLDFHAHHTASIWGSLWAQLQPNIPIEPHFHLRTTWAHDSATWFQVGVAGRPPSWAQLGPNPGQFCRFNAAR